MFEEFSKKVQKDNSVTIDFSNALAMTPEMIKEKFSDVNSLDDAALYELFKKYFNEVLDVIFTTKDPYMISLFTNSRCIVAVTQAAYSMQQLSDTQRKRCNKLVYDYIIRKEEDRNEAISDLLISFSKVINKDITPRLCGAGLSANVATMLALSRYSSEKEITNVKRLNRIIMKQPSKLMTEQMIVDIYCILFNSALNLFEGVMYDIVSPQNMNENEAEVYGTITLAVLDIVNELPLNTIKELMNRFIDNKRMLYPDNRLRFNIKSFSPEDYPRISHIIDELEFNNVIIPTT